MKRKDPEQKAGRISNVKRGGRTNKVDMEGKLRGGISQQVGTGNAMWGPRGGVWPGIGVRMSLATP